MLFLSNIEWFSLLNFTSVWNSREVLFINVHGMCTCTRVFEKTSSSSLYLLRFFYGNFHTGSTKEFQIVITSLASLAIIIRNDFNVPAPVPRRYNAWLIILLILLSNIELSPGSALQLCSTT